MQKYYYQLFFVNLCPFYKFKKFDVNFIRQVLIAIFSSDGAHQEKLDKFNQLVETINSLNT